MENQTHSTWLCKILPPQDQAKKCFCPLLTRSISIDDSTGPVDLKTAQHSSEQLLAGTEDELLLLPFFLNYLLSVKWHLPGVPCFELPDLAARSSGSPSEPAWLERSRQYRRCSPFPSEAPSRTDRIALANLGSRSPSLRPVNTSPKAMASRPGQKMCKAEGKKAVSFFPTVGKGKDACAQGRLRFAHFNLKYSVDILKKTRLRETSTNRMEHNFSKPMV